MRKKLSNTKSPTPNENMEPESMEIQKQSSRKRDEPSTSKLSNDVDNEHEVSPRKRMKEGISRDKFAISGRVAAVHLQNFMCHANLSIEFDTKHNNCFYIGGQNGSGKSALFAAINIGLGGKGSDNERGNTVKSYIKHENSSCKISITLTNEGLNSHPDYGEYVIIERSINQFSSTYTLKSVKVNGNRRQEIVVSKKKADIDRLLIRYNIHLSNPAFWMSQDRSRSFLANFKPGNVYSLYQQATNLENIKQSYARFAGTIMDLIRVVDNKKKHLEEKAKELARYKDIIRMHATISQSQKDLINFQWNLMFCPIRDIEMELKKAHLTIEKNDVFSAEKKQKILENRGERRNLMRIVVEIQEETEVYKKHCNELKSELNQIRAQIDGKKLELTNQQRELINKNAELNQFYSKLLIANKQVEKLSKKSGNEELKMKMAEVEEKYTNYQKTRENMESSGELDRLKKLKYEVAKNEDKIANQSYDARSSLKNHERALDQIKESLQRANAMKISKINRFGPRMAEIVKVMESNKQKFTKVPKGPIGKYISIIDRKWAYPIEQSIQQLANQFLCHNSNDADQLRKIFDHLGLKENERPNLIVSRFLGKEHSRLSEPDPSYFTVYRALKFSDPDIHNAVIDNAGIESILLYENNDTARQEMGSDHPPSKATKAFTLDGSLVFAGGSNGQYRFYSGKRGQAKGTFEDENEQFDEVLYRNRIDEKMQEIEKAREKVIENDKEIKRIKNEMATVNNELMAFERKLTEIRSLEMRLEREKNDLEIQLLSRKDGDELETLNICIEDLNKRISVTEDQIKILKKEIEVGSANLKPLKQKENELHLQLNAKIKDTREVEESLGRNHSKISKLDNEYDNLESLKNALENDKQKLFNNELELKAQREEIIKQVNKTKETVEKPEDADDPPDLTNFPPTDEAIKIKGEMLKKLQQAKNGVDETVTMEMVREFKNEYKHERMLIRRLSSVLETMSSILEDRVNYYPMLKKSTEMKVRVKFQELLNIRGHLSGDLEIDNEKETLNVIVTSTKEAEPNETNVGNNQDRKMTLEEINNLRDVDEEDSTGEPEKKKKKKKKEMMTNGRDLKGLSGGERSFVTAALVMSLWEVMEQPFRMMDEFDVFMDMMNRKIVMDMLVHLATEKFPQNQFIFFTPQGIKELDRVDGLQIFELQKVRD